MSFKRACFDDSYLRLLASMKILFAAIVLLSTLGRLVHAKNEEYVLTISPQDCVSLYKAQMCHLTLEFTFTAPSAKNYCLYQAYEKDPLTCWTMQSIGSFSADFATNKAVIFELRSSDQPDEVLSSAKLNVSWVYQVPNKKRAAWRLF